MQINPQLIQIHKVIILALFCMLFSCSNDDNTSQVDDSISEEESTDDTNGSNPNILLIIADDMGLDASPGYSIGDIKPNMPNLQSMINSGITFNNVWSYPTCTPTRSSMLTGRYGFRTGVTQVGDILATSETSIQKYLDENTGAAYSHAVIGKWHLSNDANHPLNMGIGYYAGLLNGAVQDYSNWNFTENGSTSTSTAYTTTKFTDLAIDWIGNQTTPWFLWLAYNAPHTPFHLPPADLHSQGSLPNDQASIDANPTPYYMASLEAMDSEMGRLLNAMSQEEKDNTLIIFIGDNGSPNQVAQGYRSQRVKGTVYQGGVNVPMIISGASVSRSNQSEDALINTTDMFASIADVAGSGTNEINDSKSFKELFSNANAEKREFVYTEVGNDSGGSDYTIRNETHKYIRFADDSEALYNLSIDPFETINLLNANQLPLSETDDGENQKLLAELENIKN